MVSVPDQPARNSWATPFLRVSWYSNTYTGTSQRAEQNSHILDFFFASRFGSFRT